MKRRQDRGFTLVELLVSIGVICILAGCLLPALAWARERARQVGCVSHVRQLGLACKMYANDWNDWIPRALDDRGDTWRSRLYAYYRTPKVLVCPSGAKRPSILGWDGSAPDSSHWWVRGYGMTCAHGTRRDASTTIAPPEDNRLTAIAKPWDTVVFSEDDDPIWVSGSYNHGVQLARQDATDRHSGGSNRVYLDGHVAFVPWKQQFCTGSEDCPWDCR